MSVTRTATGTLRRIPVRRMLVVTPLLAIGMGAAVIGARARLPDAKIAEGVHVGDLDLGGKSVEDARTALQQWAARKQASQVTLRLPPESGLLKVWKPDAAKIGLTVNVEGTLDVAGKAGREDIATQVSHLFSGAKVTLVPALPTVDDARLKQYLKRQIAAEVNRKPKNARFVILRGGGFGTHHEQPGLAVDIDASASAARQAWTGYLSAPPASAPTAGSASAAAPAGDSQAAPPSDADRGTAPQPTPLSPDEGPEALLSVKVVQPALTAAAVGQIDAVLGSMTSYVNGTPARLGNIRIAARHINGTLLTPGEVFSYNDVVGPRGEDGGYREAPILVRGRHDKGLAGGICQTSGTLFNAVLHSGLQIVERECHSTPIGYLPVGLDATVCYGSLDLKFRNNTRTPVYVAATLNGRSLTFAIFGKETPGRKISLVRGDYSRTGPSYETRADRTKPVGYHRVVEKGAGGCRVTWYRIVKENGRVVHRDVISSHYSPHAGIVVVGTRPKPHPVRRAPAAPAAAPTATPAAQGPAPAGQPGPAPR